ncbi:MAG: alpha/beta hydrolase [Thaumarchaeota archaeon]|nr:alpha/beta hydrolase [Candidatus Calditenuaceae archaeon]MDW8187592.1 alpha/beta hydrolase [Nitrososphaerota archaeon]
MTYDKEWREHVAHGKHVDVNGIRTFCVDIGRGSAVLLIHGWGSSSFTWRKNYSSLAEGFRVIAVDLPGFGLSERLKEGLRLSSVTEHLLKLAEVLGLGSLSVVGLSMGGVIASHLAATHPEWVRELVLVNPSLRLRQTGRGPPSSRLIRSGPVAALLAAVLVNRYFVRRVLRNAVWVKDVVDEEMVTGYYMSVKESGRTLLEAFDIIASFDLKTFETLKVPTLFILGERDRLVPTEANAELAGRMGSDVSTIPDAGHLVHEERPEMFNSVLKEYLSRREVYP